MGHLFELTLCLVFMMLSGGQKAVGEETGKVCGIVGGKFSSFSGKTRDLSSSCSNVDYILFTNACNFDSNNTVVMVKDIGTENMKLKVVWPGGTTITAENSKIHSGLAVFVNGIQEQIPRVVYSNGRQIRIQDMFDGRGVLLQTEEQDRIFFFQNLRQIDIHLKNTTNQLCGLCST